MDSQTDNVRKQIAAANQRIADLTALLSRTALPPLPCPEQLLTNDLENKQNVEAILANKLSQERHCENEQTVLRVLQKVIRKRNAQILENGTTDTNTTRMLSDLQSAISQQHDSRGRNSRHRSTDDQRVGSLVTSGSFRVTVYTGDMCSIQQTFVADSSVSFKEFLNQVCSFWCLENHKFRLCANIATTTHEWIEFEFQPNDKVVKALVNLAQDHSRGFGQNGNGSILSSMENHRKSQRQDLPPLYLSKMHSKHNAIDSVATSLNVANRLVNVSQIRQIFERVNSGGTDCSQLTFDEFYRLSIEYFEGTFIPLHCLQDFLVEKWGPLDLSNRCISLRITVHTLQRVSRELWNFQREEVRHQLSKKEQSRTRNKSIIATRKGSLLSDLGRPDLGEEQDSDEESMALASEVFTWMFEIKQEWELDGKKSQGIDHGSTSSSDDDSSDEEGSVHERSSIDFYTFKAAIRFAVSVLESEEIVELWNSKLKKAVTEEITQSEFLDEFWLLERVVVAEEFLSVHLQRAIPKWRKQHEHDPTKEEMVIPVSSRAYVVAWNVVLTAVALIFMVLAVFGQRSHSTDMKQLKDNVEAHLIDRPFGYQSTAVPVVESLLHFKSLTTADQFWSFVFHDESCETCQSPLQTFLFSHSESSVNRLTPPTVTLRQDRRARKPHCAVTGPSNGTCVDPGNPDTRPYGPQEGMPKNETDTMCGSLNPDYARAFVYCQDLMPSMSSVTSSRSGVAGFGTSVDSKLLAGFRDTMLRLRDGGWIDMQTAKVVVSFTMFNRNTNLYAEVVLEFSFTAGGLVKPVWEVRSLTANLYPAQPGWKGFTLFLVTISLVAHLKRQRMERIRMLEPNALRSIVNSAKTALQTESYSWLIFLDLLSFLVIAVAVGLVQRFSYSGLRLYLEEQTPGFAWHLAGLHTEYRVLQFIDSFALGMLIVTLTSSMLLQRSTSITYDTVLNAGKYGLLQVMLAWVLVVVMFAIVLRAVSIRSTDSFLYLLGNLILTTLGSPDATDKVLSHAPVGVALVFSSTFFMVAFVFAQAVVFALIQKAYFEQRSQLSKELRHGLPGAHDWNIWKLISPITPGFKSKLKDRVVLKHLNRNGGYDYSSVKDNRFAIKSQVQLFANSFAIAPTPIRLSGNRAYSKLPRFQFS